MKQLILFYVLIIFLATACTKGSDIAYIDKDKRAIVSTKGDPFKKVMVTGGGKQVTFRGMDNSANDAIIYFNRVNQGFLVSEGFGLNKDYILKLKPNSKYTVYIFADPKDETAYPIKFRTDYNNNIVLESDEDK
jgi:hypothetical protein